MRKGQLSVKNPLMLKLTTAYAESDSIMLEELEYDRAVLNGTVDNKRLFALLYYSTVEEAWTDEGLYKANPLRVEENYNWSSNDIMLISLYILNISKYITKQLILQ